MFLVLVNILVVLVAREKVSSLGAPATIRLFHHKLPVINSTATQTEAVPVESYNQDIKMTQRKVSVNMTEHNFTKSFQDEVNQVHQLSEHKLFQLNDTEKLSSLEDTAERTTERTASTVYEFQSTTIQERSLAQLLNLARMKYLGHDLRLLGNYYEQIDTFRRGKTTTSRTSEQRQISSAKKSRRKISTKLNQHARFGSSRWRMSGIKDAEDQTTSMKQQPTTTMPETAATINKAISDGSIFETSRTEIDNSAHTTITTTRNDLTGLHLPHAAVPMTSTESDYTATPSSDLIYLPLETSQQVSDPPFHSQLRKRLAKMTDMFQAMSAEKAQSANSRQNGRSLTNEPGYLISSIQNIYDPNESKVGKVTERLAPGSKFVTMISHNLELPESSETDNSTEGSGLEEPYVFDGQYHESEPGQYHEFNPGQYHEVNPGQYHELNPGQYHETDPGQYHELNPGQEVKLNIEFNPEEETKSYNVHKKTGDYIIGEVGKINVNNGQTLEGVRYTAVDGIVDQAQIAEILKRFFGTK